jgi:hypothetical protein
MGYLTLLVWMDTCTMDVRNRAAIQRYLTEMLVPGVIIGVALGDSTLATEQAPASLQAVTKDSHGHVSSVLIGNTEGSRRAVDANRVSNFTERSSGTDKDQDDWKDCILKLDMSDPGSVVCWDLIMRTCTGGTFAACLYERTQCYIAINFGCFILLLNVMGYLSSFGVAAISKTALVSVLAPVMIILMYVSTQLFTAFDMNNSMLEQQIRLEQQREAQQISLASMCTSTGFKQGQEVDPDAVDIHSRPFQNAVHKLQELKDHYPLRVMGLSANAATVSIISSLMVYSVSALLYGFVMNSDDAFAAKIREAITEARS